MAFAQVEEWEKGAQEALEEPRQKHAVAQEACASVDKEIEEEGDDDDECMHDADQYKGRDPYREWYNPSAQFSHSTEIQEVRTAVSRILATLALLVKASLGHLGSGYTVPTAAVSDTSVGRACGRNFKLRRPHGALCPGNSTQAPGRFRGGEKDTGKRAGKQSSGEFRGRSCECIATFSKCIGAAHSFRLTA